MGVQRSGGSGAMLVAPTQMRLRCVAISSVAARMLGSEWDQLARPIRNSILVNLNHGDGRQARVIGLAASTRRHRSIVAWIAWPDQ